MKDQADATAPNFLDILGRSLKKILSLEQDFALLDFAVGRQKLQKRSCKSALA